MKYRCEGCGKYLDEKEVERYDNTSLCHTVASGNPEDGYEPEPCGPVKEA